MSNSREIYNLKKIQKFNNIDRSQNPQNIDNIKNMILKPQKIEKPDLNIEKLVKNREENAENDLKNCIKNRTNTPYKGIIKNFDYNRKFNKTEDLIVHKVTDADKLNFDKDVDKYKSQIAKQDVENKDVYSKAKEEENKKKFEYQHKYKYRGKIVNETENDLRVDRIEFYKKEQQKIEDNKKKIDDILINLIDTGIVSENLDNINYDKVDVNELEKTLIAQFGEEEFNKLMNEIKN
jgi:hypothetical protein